MMNTLVKALIILAVISIAIPAQQRSRVKDVATFTGLEDLQLYGYGLIVGLGGTGDRSQTVFTTQTVLNMLKNMGVELPDQYVRTRNVAAVMVTGTLSPFKKRGTKLDVTVSSMGDATSLAGGTLILTQLQGPDGKMYASAQGPIATGGYDITTVGPTRIKKNHVMVGMIPDGAIVQHEFAISALDAKNLSLSLSTPDFTSAVAMAQAINKQINLLRNDTTQARLAVAKDAATVALSLDNAYLDSLSKVMQLVEFISVVENVEFDVASQARIVVNERTGTIVAGGNVRISQVAVNHGGVKVEIVNRAEVIQPQPFSLGKTEIIPNPGVLVEEKDHDMVVLDNTTTVSELAQALNSLGVAPLDVIAIFQAIKQAGALQGQLIIM